MSITAEIKKDYIIKLAKTGKRLDNRKFDEFRKINIETGTIKKAEGSAKVTIGNTQVIAGIKMDLGEPYPDTPDSGVMTTAAELIPMASPDFESGPPDSKSIELARVVDRGIRESKIIDIKLHDNESSELYTYKFEQNTVQTVLVTYANGSRTSILSVVKTRI